MSIRFDDRVALVTGAGNGLGRAYALALAERGATVVVNDLGGTREGSGGSATAAETVTEEIREHGGTALADATDITDEIAAGEMVARVIAEVGRLDIVINNAGILRDRSFAKMDTGEFDSVLNVHLRGSFFVTRAAWSTMRETGYGRVLMTTSSSGLYGNFGQSNYGAAKMGVLGLMTTLSIEGAKHGIHVNAISPTALTRMTEDLALDPAMGEKLTPQSVVPAALYLVSEHAPTRTILAAGAGGYAAAQIMETDGLWLPEAERTPETIAARLGEIADFTTAKPLAQGGLQTAKFLKMAMEGA